MKTSTLKSLRIPSAQIVRAAKERVEAASPLDDRITMTGTALNASLFLHDGSVHPQVRRLPVRNRRFRFVA
jgi:hypothetical protein